MRRLALLIGVLLIAGCSSGGGSASAPGAAPLSATVAVSPSPNSLTQYRLQLGNTLHLMDARWGVADQAIESALGQGRSLEASRTANLPGLVEQYAQAIAAVNALSSPECATAHRADLIKAVDLEIEASKEMEMTARGLAARPDLWALAGNIPFHRSRELHKNAAAVRKVALTLLEQTTCG